MSTVLATFFFPKCGACLEPVNALSFLCYRCGRRIFKQGNKAPNQFLLPYDKGTRCLIRGIRRDAIETSTECFLRILKRNGWIEHWCDLEVDCVVWAPTSAPILGFTILGKKIAKELDAQWLHSPLEKIKNSFQHGLSRSQRMNTPGMAVLNVRRQERIRGKKILLLDDVVTTGTTLEYSAYLLRKAGARSVQTFALSKQLLVLPQQKLNTETLGSCGASTQ